MRVWLGLIFAGQAAQKATSIIPIGVLASHDGVGSCFYKSLARPGGNITGSESMAPELDAKRVEILKDIFPQLSHLTVLHNPTFAGAKLHSDAILSSAAKQNTKVQFVEILTVADFDAAFAVLLHDRPDAVLTVADNLIFQRRQRIVSFGNEHRIPMIHESKIFVKEGALISYGADVEEVFRRGADFVDKILRGEKAGDIPVEQPTKFDFAINLKTAKELGVTFPNNVILSANVVID